MHPAAGPGLSVPQVAGLVECNPVTVRDAVRRFVGGGFDALADAPRPGRPAQVTDEDLNAVGALLDASAEARQPPAPGRPRPPAGRTGPAGGLTDYGLTDGGRRGHARCDLPPRVGIRAHHAHRLHLVTDRAAGGGAL
ncbi:helix-turn-helix domain-containing protein [Streptomyces sp. NPDC002920]